MRLFLVGSAILAASMATVWAHARPAVADSGQGQAGTTTTTQAPNPPAQNPQPQPQPAADGATTRPADPAPQPQSSPAQSQPQPPPKPAKTTSSPPSTRQPRTPRPARVKAAAANGENPATGATQQPAGSAPVDPHTQFAPVVAQSAADAVTNADATVAASLPSLELRSAPADPTSAIAISHTKATAPAIITIVIGALLLLFGAGMRVRRTIFGHP
jgi:outer membrane biosynthesis protein TonB